MTTHTTALSKVLAAQPRTQCGTVSYDRRSEDSNFAEHLANLTPIEQLKCSLFGLVLIGAGGFAAIVLWQGARTVTGWLLKL